MPSTHPLVDKFRTGEVPPHLKTAAARGALPLEAADLVEILFHLRKDPSREIQQDIVRTLEGMPEDAVQAVASAADTTPAMLDFLARASIRRDNVLEHIIRNASTADATLALLGQHGSDSVLELLSYNQVRLTRAPAILAAIFANPKLSVSVRRRLDEISELNRHESAAGAARDASTRAAAAAAAEAAAPPVAAVAPPPPASLGSSAVPTAAGPAPELADGELAAPAGEEGAGLEEVGELGDLSGIGLDSAILEEMAADDATEEELRLAQRLLMMTVPDKVQLALKGNREARMVLIRDASKQVQESVINSPKITENEIERISKMRSVGEDVIRMLSNKREVMKSYAVVHNLITNPKTPQPIAMQLMTRLQNRDLLNVSKDKNVPDVVRRHALITLEKRTPKGGKK